LGMEQRAIAAPRRARHRNADELLVLVRNLRLCQIEVSEQDPEASGALRYLLEPIRHAAEHLFHLAIHFAPRNGRTHGISPSWRVRSLLGLRELLGAHDLDTLRSGLIKALLR